MICSLCNTRKARRSCPALNQQICPVCCGTKRMVEISCPADCPWLASAREHPPAVVVRQQQKDAGLLARLMIDLSRRQAQLFLLVTSFLNDYQPQDLYTVIDNDVAGAADALAATFETSARGVIYDHRPPSLPAERLVRALKPLLAEAGQGLGTAFERDAAVVLRRVSAAVQDVRAHDPDNARGFVDLLRRVLRRPDAGADQGEDRGEAAPSGLIVP